MEDPSRTNQELIKEISALKQKIKEMEQSESEPKRVSGELRESEEYFKAIIQNASDIILIVDKLGTITYASPSVERILGYGPDELIGKRILDLIVSDDKPKAIADFGRALLTKDVPIPNVFRIRHKNGTDRFLEGVGKNLLDNPIVAGFVMNVRDITERKQVENSLRESEERYRTILENIEDGYFEVDIAGKFTFFNDSVCRILGYTRAEMMGMNNRQYTDKENRKILYQAFNKVFRTGEPSTGVDYEIIRKDATKLYIQSSVSLIRNTSGQPIGFRGIMRNISERKQAEKQLQDTLESLRRAVGTTIRVVASAVESRDPYTAGHQIRSANLARAIATEMGLLQDIIEGIRIAGSIHDIGKLSIPAEILSKPIKLSEIEFPLIKEHAHQGYEILKSVESSWPLAEIVHQHHERMDGSGYPRKLKGEEILLEARVLNVADVVEAMASDRPYRPGLGIEAALNEIEKNRGIFYDNTVADACLRLFREKGFTLEGT